MCNLSKGVEEKGIQKGIEQGIEQGIEKGIEQGIEKGIEQGIKQGIIAMISTLRELQVSNDIIIDKICEKFQLTEETAREYLLKI